MQQLLKHRESRRICDGN